MQDSVLRRGHTDKSSTESLFLEHVREVRDGHGVRSKDGMLQVLMSNVPSTLHPVRCKKDRAGVACALTNCSKDIRGKTWDDPGSLVVMPGSVVRRVQLRSARCCKDFRHGRIASSRFSTTILGLLIRSAWNLCMSAVLLEVSLRAERRGGRVLSASVPSTVVTAEFPLMVTSCRLGSLVMKGTISVSALASTAKAGIHASTTPSQAWLQLRRLRTCWEHDAATSAAISSCTPTGKH